MEVKPGYKKTEVGVIPEDWKIAKLADISAFITKGATPTTYGFRWQNEGVVFLSSESITEGGIDFSNARAISAKADKMLNRSEIKTGDILISITGYVGRVAMYDIVAPANINQHIARVRITSKAARSLFLFYWLKQKKVQRYFERIVTGQAYPQISLVQVRNTSVPIPTPTEQDKIAQALSDVDASISALSRLITKKRDIRQSTMQRLLSDRTRLSGFTAPWQEKRLSEIAQIKTGTRNNEDKVSTGKYPFFVRSETIERINSFSYDCEAILVPGEGKIGEIFHYVHGRFDVHQRVYAITNFADNVSAKFVHLFMSQSFGSWAMQNTVKATVDSLRLPTFQNFLLRLPPTIEEQNAIASVISDITFEVTMLEQRQKKLNAIKNAMMQSLLTGRVRLPVTRDAKAALGEAVHD